MKQNIYFISKDEHLQCLASLPELKVVLRTHSGELFEGMNGPCRPAAEVW